MPRIDHDPHQTPASRHEGPCLANISRVFPASLLVSLALCLLPGCGKGDDLTPPTYSPDQAAKLAMAEYDTNQDGYLDAKELERCPAMKNSLDSIDTNGDHRLSAEEISARVRTYADSH